MEDPREAKGPSTAKIPEVHGGAMGTKVELELGSGCRGCGSPAQGGGFILLVDLNLGNIKTEITELNKLQNKCPGTYVH